MLLTNKTLDAIIDGRISLIFRVWKRATVKTGGSLRTRLGVLSIDKVERIDAAEITEEDLYRAGAASLDEILAGGREGDLYRIAVSFAGADPRLERRENLDPDELASIAARLRQTGDWCAQYLDIIAARPNIHAQILADHFGLEKLKFKAKVRRLKELGLTISLRPGYKLSPRGEAVLKLLKD